MKNIFLTMSLGIGLLFLASYMPKASTHFRTRHYPLKKE